MKNTIRKGLSIIIIGSWIFATLSQPVSAQDKKKSAVCDSTQNKNTVIEAEKPPSLDSDKLFEMVNNHRHDSGLKPLIKDERICEIARSRGPELYKEIMVTGTMHAGFYARDLKYWATENLIYMQTETQALNWWLNSSIHRRAIEGDYQYSCTECYGNSCTQIFTNFQSKTLSSK